MVILGVDPGSRVTGYGLVGIEGSRLRCLDFGVVRNRSGRSGSFPRQLRRIHEELDRVIRRHQPHVVAVEDVFHAANARSALKLGHARGVVLLAAARHDTPLVEYTALQVKKAVVGYGRADKSQIQHMVRRLLNLKEDPQPHDAADALAVALCHAFNGSAVRRSPRRWKSLR